MSGEAARSNGRRSAWAGLVGVTIVLAFIVRQGVGLPEDFRDSYWTVLVGPGLERDHAWCRGADRRAGQSARAARAASADVVVAGWVERRAGGRRDRAAARASSVPPNQRRAGTRGRVGSRSRPPVRAQRGHHRPRLTDHRGADLSRSGLHAVGALRPGMGDRADRSHLCALPRV